jgi:nitrogen regulatory protein PII
MEPVKRIEIVTDALEMREVTKLLEAHGVTGWTIVRDVVGSGERGVQSGDELTDVFKNSMLITACPASKAEELVEGVRKILRKRGGICLVSDALSIRH